MSGEVFVPSFRIARTDTNRPTMSPDLKANLVSRAGALFIRVLYALLRVRHVGVERIEACNRSGESYVLSFWHRYLLLMVYSRHRKPIVVMSSKHRDGEYMARTLERFGITAVRGSSTRGGASALREMIDRAGRGQNIAFTPDGPRGPALVAQPGVVLAAQHTGCPVIPAAIVAERKKVLRSWDGFEIPKPLSRVLFVYGEPIRVPRELDRPELERYRLAIQNAMTALTEDTQRDFDALWRSAAR